MADSNYLQDLSLSPQHTTLYLALIELGKATYKDLAEKTNIPRSSCYEYIPDLVKVGLVVEVTENKRKYLLPETPEKVAQLLKSKTEQITKNLQEYNQKLPKLLSQFGALTDRPQFQFYKGEEGIKTILNSTLDHQDEILVLCQGKESMHLLDQEPLYLQKYYEDFRNQGGRSREIVEDRGPARDYLKKYNSSFQKIRLSPPLTRSEISHVDKFIWGDKVAIILFDENRAILIADHHLANNERISFEVLWNALEKGDYRY